MPSIRRRSRPLYPTTRCGWVIALVVALLVPPTSVAAELPADASMVQVSNQLYQFSDGTDAGAFLVTDNGIAVIDPLKASTAKWLKDELESRFGQSVKYVIYSSHLPHRTGGAEIFTDATIIAQENAVDALLSSGAALPSIVFSDSLTIRLGGQEIVLQHAGPSVTDDALIAHFPAEQAVYAGDLVAIEQVPRLTVDALRSSSADNWATAVDQMNRIDFVYLLTSHTGVGIQNDARKHGRFLRELTYRIKRALQQGDSADAIGQSVTMANYAHWSGSEKMPQLVDGFMHSLQHGQNQ